MKKLLALALFLNSSILFAQTNDTCSNVNVKIDKFDGDTTYTTPTVDGIQFMKFRLNGKFVISAILERLGYTVASGSGCVILLEGGKKIERKNLKINLEAVRGGVMYTAILPLSDTDIELLLKNKITDFRLYVFEKSVIQADQIIKDFNCLVSK